MSSRAAEATPIPTNSIQQGFLTAARSMLVRAEADGDLLVGKGLSETLLEDLAQAVAEFEATGEKSRTSRWHHVGARADLAAVTVEIKEQVRLLERLVVIASGTIRR